MKLFISIFALCFALGSVSFANEETKPADDHAAPAHQTKKKEKKRAVQNERSDKKQDKKHDKHEEEKHEENHE